MEVETDGSDTEDELSRKYYDPRFEGSFGGVEKLATSTGISRKKAQAFLQKQLTYSLHRPARKTFETRRVEVYGVDSQWQADLADMQRLSRINKGYKYLLTCIDVFSKFAWVEPVKNKTGPEVTRAFERILATGRYPLKLQTDEGKEFENSTFQNLLKSKGINFFTVKSSKKASVVERFNRTLKEILWRYFTKTNSQVYINVLQDVVYGYNHRYHSSIKMRPIDVNLNNEDKVREILFPKHEAKGTEKLISGDYVRISKNKMLFEKGYLPNFQEELFIVTKVKNTQPKMYKLKDLLDEKLIGSFYGKELQRVDTPDLNSIFIIEKILRKRQKGAKTEYYVKWRGYPKKFNSWIDNITKI